jgi:hypothetical protein
MRVVRWHVVDQYANVMHPRLQPTVQNADPLGSITSEMT